MPSDTKKDVAIALGSGGAAAVITALLTQRKPGEVVIDENVRAALAALLLHMEGVHDLLNQILEKLSQAPPGAVDGRLDYLANYVKLVPLHWGKATNASINTMTQDGQMWETNIWTGSEVTVIEGTGKGQTRSIVTNSRDTLTVRTNWVALPDSTSVFVIRLRQSTPIRWGHNIEPEWVHAAETTAPAASTTLVSKAVTVGKSGYIYGFLLSAQEANDFKINWTSGGSAYSKRIIFGGSSTTEAVDPIPLNEGLSADGGTSITITNVNAAAAGKVYQANLLFGEI